MISVIVIVKSHLSVEDSVEEHFTQISVSTRSHLFL